ncbi:hypothetical protein C488_03080 [Natrinema pellirubrum DSM 15624]|uniref:CARDB domain-containing protein n=1 Tax=Natrinema pellirubrum (strain DSM 15624 / CIP 106293 / JCM 10476 / NCIMB 786 / 157) TaxID=797303 RepID=L0JJ65_NATP1|nr:CARDB domain-containing protein [Natrinema pellirubrum]AGB30873.1 CARDB domain-containing protein [Natrinema pellirubrum DSM 15624]ELY80738.1 hypothetical protein C488_03080 [Natrinema pellirubrum DSM 15624]
MSRRRIAAVVVIAAAMIASVVAVPLLGGIVGDDAGTETDATSPPGPEAQAQFQNESGNDAAGGNGFDPIRLPPPGATEETETDTDAGGTNTAAAQSDREEAVEEGVSEGVALVQSQGIEVTQAQRAAALEGARQSVSQSQNVEAEQVQAATAGAVHGTLLQQQSVNVTQIQYGVGGATGGALSQSQSANATQLQSASWGAAHGAVAQSQHVSVEQLQVATRGAAAGAASEAGAKDVGAVPKIQEAAQGAAYGVLTQYQSVSVEQRQRVTLDHVQHAAAGAAAGALEGSTTAALAQRQTVDVRQDQRSESRRGQRVDAEQRQRVTIKQIQKAAAGAAKGALVQKQRVSVEGTQAAARGAGRGSLKQVQSTRIEQVQRISITQVQEASSGAAKGAISGSQDASVEQIQAAADGSAGGVLIQRQSVSVTQVQYAAVGAAEGAIASAVQRQAVTIEQVQAAAFGAGQGTVSQTQLVDVTQVQRLAYGGASGALVQAQDASITQIQVAASSAASETARVVQSQRISITQLQTITQEAAADATAYAVSEDTADITVISQHVEIEVEQRIETVDRIEGTASIDFSDQESDGDAVTIDDVSLSEGGFVAVYEGVAVDADPDAIIGVSSYLEAGDHENVTVDLEESLNESGPLVAVVHHDTDGDEAFEYADSDGEEDVPYVSAGGAPVLDGAFVTVADEPAEPAATLSVADQTGNGTTLTIDEANASVPYGLNAVYDNETAGSEPFAAGENVTNYTLELEPPLEENASVAVAVVGEDSATLANETIEYTVANGTTEPEATLSVDDQDGEGESLAIDAASATVPYVVTAEYDGERVDSELFEANETVAETAIDLEPPLESNATVDVSVRAVSDDAVLANDSIEYTVVEPEPGEPTANLSVADQTGDGETLTVTSANASVEYVLTVADENGGRLAETERFAANETIGPREIALEPPLESNATLEVSVVAADDGTPIETDEVAYTVDGAVPDFDVEFTNCSRAVVEADLEAGDTVAASTGFYTSGGFGNTIIEDFVTAGENVEAPFDGTIVFEIGDERNVTADGDEVTVEVPDYGTFGTYISGISSPEAAPFASIDHPNPDLEACDDEARPELPSLSVEETEPTADGDAINVTFGYENPNDAAVAANSEFVEGTTTDEPPSGFEPGEHEFTVEWTPESDNERLVWQADFTNHGYEEPVTVATPPAGEIRASVPAAFSVSIASITSPVEQGQEIAVESEIENVGGEAGTQEVALAIDGTVVDTESVSLEAGESRSVAFDTETGALEPGEYTLAVSSDNDTAERTVTVEESGAPATVAVTDLAAPASGEPGQQVTVTATVENRGDLEGTETVTYSVDGRPLAEATVTLAGGQSAEIPFTSPIPEGTSTHTVATDDDEASVVIEAAEEPRSETNGPSANGPALGGEGTGDAGNETTG